MFLLLTTAAAALASCEFAVSPDGRFCCPSWCKTCGGEEGECSTTTLEEVGQHACGKFAPPCLLSVARDPVRALDSAGRDVLDLDDVVVASGTAVAPNRTALRLRATDGALPADLNVTARDTMAVKIEIPDDPNLNSAVALEVRAHVAAELRSLAAKAQERFVSANAELAKAAAEVNRAREAEEVDVDTGGPSIANLSAPPLYARLLPEFPAVQAASKEIFAAGHAWQAHRPGDVELVFNAAMNKSVRAVRAAVRDGRDLQDALDEMDRRAARRSLSPTACGTRPASAKWTQASSTTSTGSAASLARALSSRALRARRGSGRGTSGASGRRRSVSGTRRGAWPRRASR
jgi:hypothetical protein